MNSNQDSGFRIQGRGFCSRLAIFLFLFPVFYFSSSESRILNPESWFLTPAHADIKVDITRGNVEPIPIAIPAFFGSNGNAAQFGRDIAQVVSNDLVRSGLFTA